MGYRTITLGSRADGFYEKCGYTAEGETYLDQHCPHIHMFKLL